MKLSSFPDISCLANPSDASGPPGTGKTQTCAAILCDMAKQYGKGKVLACAYNNVAIDELSKRTKATGGEALVVVRLGEPSRSDPEAQRMALSSIEGSRAANLKKQTMEAHDKVKEARRKRDQKGKDGSAAQRREAMHIEASQKLTAKMQSLKSKKNKFGVTHTQAKKFDKELEKIEAALLRLKNAIHVQKQVKEAAYADERALDNTVGPLLGQLRELEGKRKAIHKEILDGADVICCTCIGAASSDLKYCRFSAVLIDECTQAMEPACVIPLLKLVDGLDPACPAARIILAGDHKQLPPTVMSGQGSPLCKSLFERMMDEVQVVTLGGAGRYSAAQISIASRMLSVQYRMHSQISAFPSREFYGGQLQNGIEDCHRALPLLPMQASIKQACRKTTPLGQWCCRS